MIECKQYKLKAHTYNYAHTTPRISRDKFGYEKWIVLQLEVQWVYIFSAF